MKTNLRSATLRNNLQLTSSPTPPNMYLTRSQRKGHNIQSGAMGNLIQPNSFEAIENERSKFEPRSRAQGGSLSKGTTVNENVIGECSTATKQHVAQDSGDCSTTKSAGSNENLIHNLGTSESYGNVSQSMCGSNRYPTNRNANGNRNCTGGSAGENEVKSSAAKQDAGSIDNSSRPRTASEIHPSTTQSPVIVENPDIDTNGSPGPQNSTSAVSFKEKPREVQRPGSLTRSQIYFLRMETAGYFSNYLTPEKNPILAKRRFYSYVPNRIITRDVAKFWKTA